MGIYVANVPDYGVEEVADSAMNHILNLMRHTVQASLHTNNVLLRVSRSHSPLSPLVSLNSIFIRNVTKTLR